MKPGANEYDALAGRVGEDAGYMGRMFQAQFFMESLGEEDPEEKALIEELDAIKGEVARLEGGNGGVK